jgi:hypothetical protein
LNKRTTTKKKAQLRRLKGQGIKDFTAGKEPGSLNMVKRVW